MYQRSVYNFFQMFAQIGGVFELLWIAGLFIVSSFAALNFRNSLLSRLYHVEVKEKYSENEVCPFSKKKQLNTTMFQEDAKEINDFSSIPPHDNSCIGLNTNPYDNSNTKDDKNSEICKTEHEISKHTDAGTHKKAVESMKYRRRYSYKITHIVLSLFCRCNIKSKNKKISNFNEYRNMYK